MDEQDGRWPEQAACHSGKEVGDEAFISALTTRFLNSAEYVSGESYAMRTSSNVVPQELTLSYWSSSVRGSYTQVHLYN